MDINAAAYRLVHGHKGGAKAVAALVGRSYQVVINEVNPTNTAHKFGLADAVECSEATGNPVVLFAFAERMGFVCMPARFGSQCGESPLLALSGLMAAHGDVGEAISLAIADGRIDVAELADIEDAVLHNIEDLHGVLRAVKSAHKRGVVHAPG